MVWAMWNIQDQNWEFTSDDGVGPTYCHECEVHDVRVIHGTEDEALQVVEAARKRRSGNEEVVPQRAR